MKAKWMVLVLSIVLGAALTACGGGDGGSDGGDDDGDGGGGSSTTLTVTAPVGASNSGFTETSLSAPADTPFTIEFDNQDGGLPHNVQIFEGDDTSVTPVWAPEGNALITGPDTATYEIPALSAGTYTFNCLSHPATMVGTLTVG